MRIELVDVVSSLLVVVRWLMKELLLRLGCWVTNLYKKYIHTLTLMKFEMTIIEDCSYTIIGKVLQTFGPHHHSIVALVISFEITMIVC